MTILLAGEGIRPLGPRYLANLIILGKMSLVEIQASNSKEPSII
jgi:hypothetical protein